jgi:hypothetical protein
MADWTDVARLAISTVVPAASGLCGVWFGSWAATRRERRNEKRDAYAALLVGLQATRVVYQRIQAFYESHLPTADADGLTRLIDERWGPQLREARDKLNSAMAIGRLILTRDVRIVIDRYLQQDTSAFGTPGLFQTLRARQEAMEQTMVRLEEIAWAELGLD